jgi:serine/threonine protein kinase
VDLIGGRFRPKRLVGVGAVAAVHLCDDLETGEEAAVKILHKSVCTHAPLVERFRSETDTLLKLRHPHIIRVFAAGEHEGAPWHAGTYARRGSLADVVLREGGVSVDAMLKWASQLLDALAYIHGLDMVHRDVKPENILIDEADDAILGDFGIALVPESRVTKVDAQLGTPAYMAPEQHKDSTQVGPLADLYALGTSIFVSLTKQSGMLLLMAHTRDEALAALPGPVAALVDKATAFRPEDRFADATDMKRAVDEVRAQLAAEGAG